MFGHLGDLLFVLLSHFLLLRDVREENLVAAGELIASLLQDVVLGADPGGAPHAEEELDLRATGNRLDRENDALTKLSCRVYVRTTARGAVNVLDRHDTQRDEVVVLPQVIRDLGLVRVYLVDDGVVL